ncbi:hypothetical protein, partial [Thiocapsa sp.]|uniref:hypothetical protein n=1 Tax=Thiocapsa sp. TaxID=2024551 RepID=UPI0025D754B9
MCRLMIRLTIAALGLTVSVAASLAGPLTDQLASMKSDEEVLAATIPEDAFEPRIVLDEVSAMLSELAGLGGKQKRLIMNCYVDGSPEAKVERCNAWSNEIVLAVGAQPAERSGLLASLEPRFADGLLVDGVTSGERSGVQLLLANVDRPK